MLFRTIILLKGIVNKTIRIRDRPRFFDQVGHETTNAPIGNKHFVTNV